MFSAFHYKKENSITDKIVHQLINAEPNPDQTVEDTSFDFNYNHFKKLNDNMLIIYYLLNHTKSRPVNEEETFCIFEKKIYMEIENDFKLVTLLKFISSNQFEENIDFSSIYSNFLVNLEISVIYTHIIIQLVIISKKAVLYADFIIYLKDKTNFIYEECFWKLYLFLGKNENIDSSNLLYVMGITKWNDTAL